jgi:signal transduction histidine kinase
MLAYTGLIVLGFAGLARLAGGQIAQAAVEDFATALQAQAALVARSLDEPFEHLVEGDNDAAQTIQQASNLAGQLQARLVLFDRDGRVWFDSAAPAQESPTHGPEVATALAGRAGYGVRADAAGNDTVYAAAPIYHDERVLGVVQLARPLAVATAAVYERWLALGAGVAVLGLLAVGASLWLAASLTRPLEQLRASALRLAAGDFSQRLPATGRDEFGQVATAFNYMAGQVQAMLDEQRAFASNASHELRTPLTTIRLRSEALRQGALDPALAHQYIAEIDDEVARLGGLVEDLILLSRLDAGRAERGTEEVDVARLARALVRELCELPEAQGLTLTLETPAPLPTVRAGSNHVRVVLRNLLGNAANYTPPGGCVTCRLEMQDAWLHITVVDSGQGVAPEDLPHLFERFYRTDKSHGRTVRGAGLGLPLVQSIVQAYGGTITLESPGLDRGTTVRVLWPVDAAS